MRRHRTRADIPGGLGAALGPVQWRAFDRAARSDDLGRTTSGTPPPGSRWRTSGRFSRRSGARPPRRPRKCPQALRRRPPAARQKRKRRARGPRLFAERSHGTSAARAASRRPTCARRRHRGAGGARTHDPGIMSARERPGGLPLGRLTSETVLDPSRRLTMSVPSVCPRCALESNARLPGNVRC